MLRSVLLRMWGGSSAGVLLAALLIAAPPAGAVGRSVPATSGALALSRHPVGQLRRWRSYDEAPATAVVRPVRVLEVSGNVSDPQALTDPSSGQTSTLRYPASLVLDYGQDVGGFPEFDVASGAGTIATSYSETLRNLGNDGAGTVALFASGNGTRSDSFSVSGPGTVKAATISGGERYEQVTLTGAGTVMLRSAGIVFTAVRETLAVMSGHFLSSDDLLNRIWYAGAYTLNLDQMTPGTVTTPGEINRLHLLLDGAKRDRAVWSGDQLMSELTDYYVSDPAYARDSLMLLLTHPLSSANSLSAATGNLSQPGPLPGACTPNPVGALDGLHCVAWSASYSMLVIPALYNYYLYTGDLGFVRAHWQAVERQMQWDAQQVDAHGLFSVNAQDGEDWNLEDPTGEVTYVNAVYVEALNSAAKLAAALGKVTEAQHWGRAAVRVKDAVNGILWNPKTGVYEASNTIRGAVVQDANVTAILAGIASGHRGRRILAVLHRALATQFGPAAATANASGYIRDISPYMGGLNVLADFADGNAAGAVALMRQEWGYMVNHDPGGTDWERIEPSGIPAGTTGPLMASDSSAHAWSTGPTAAMSRYILGVTPQTAGFASWAVAPTVADLRYAQGVVPTLHGALAVRWRRDTHANSFELTVIAPHRTHGVVEIPLLGHRRVVAMDGRVVWDGQRAGGGAHAHAVPEGIAFTGISGQHTFAWESS